MEATIKEIYKTFTGQTINKENYIIKSSSMNSILKDRFIAELGKFNIVWNGEDIEYKDLIRQIKTTQEENLDYKIDETKINNSLKLNTLFSIGIDIQYIDELPSAVDYWDDPFFVLKFHKSEIAYATLKNNPRETLTGIYSAKEALIKCDNKLIWKDIQIKYDINGKPSFLDYSISISHSKEIALAIAIKNNSTEIGKSIQINNFEESDSVKIETEVKISKEYTPFNKKSISLISLFVSIFILIYIIIKDFTTLI